MTHGTPQLSRVQSRGGIQGAFFGGGGGWYSLSSTFAFTARFWPSVSDSFALSAPVASRVSLPAPPISRTLGPLPPPVTVTVSLPPSP